MHQIADRHQVSLGTVGDWLDAEGATTAPDINPHRIIEQFAAAYIGPFPDERDYTRHRMSRLGWTQALHAAGIPDRYLDLHAITRDWFTHQVRRIDSGSWGRIEVFHRGQPT
jgi:antirestriction protein